MKCLQVLDCFFCLFIAQCIDNRFIYILELWLEVVQVFGRGNKYCCEGVYFMIIYWLLLVICIEQMMKQRHKIEKESNIGDEVGWTKNQEVAKVNPKLAAMNKKFGMIHGLSSLANIVSFGCLAMHSWYLAGKINF